MLCDVDICIYFESSNTCMHVACMYIVHRYFNELLLLPTYVQYIQRGTFD